jgi:hypothetical protein
MTSTYMLIGIALDFLGTFMLGYTVLSVHARMAEEHKFDDAVYKAIKRERLAGFIGLFLIAIGFAIQASFYYFI